MWEWGRGFGNGFPQVLKGEGKWWRSSLSPLLLIPLILPPFLLPPLPSTLFPAPLPPLPIPAFSPVSAVTSQARSPSLLGRKLSFEDRESAGLQFSLGTQYNIYCKRSCSVSLLISWCLLLVGEQEHRKEVL